MKAEYYRDGERQLWQELNKAIPTPLYHFTEVTERLLFVQVLEAFWCLQEKVIRSVSEGNIGSIYGWGFPSVRGGVFQFVNDYGVKDFIEKCSLYEKRHGQRFKIPKILKEMK
jgi:3-hydroxyacyl-CoA dehydrogenase / enoyl-CoA hydratase / 3-hydroxybutyryl-CoA epimerase